jgi:hypothetical protein
MKKIESQISNQVSFTGVTLEELPKYVQSMTDKISVGLSRMKESKLFTQDEIKQIQEFATKLINVRADAHQKMMTEQAREKFRFF